MWLIVTAFAAIIATIVWYVSDAREKYKVGLLSLVFWGTVLMVFVDHTLGFLEEGEFFDLSADAAALSAVLVITGLMVWLLYLFAKDPKGVLRKAF